MRNGSITFLCSGAILNHLHICSPRSFYNFLVIIIALMKKNTYLKLYLPIGSYVSFFPDNQTPWHGIISFIIKNHSRPNSGIQSTTVTHYYLKKKFYFQYRGRGISSDTRVSGRGDTSDPRVTSFIIVVICEYRTRVFSFQCEVLSFCVVLVVGWN